MGSDLYLNPPPPEPPEPLWKQVKDLEAGLKAAELVIRQQKERIKDLKSQVESFVASFRKAGIHLPEFNRETHRVSGESDL